jgi:hypothetical protein
MPDLLSENRANRADMSPERREEIQHTCVVWERGHYHDRVTVVAADTVAGVDTVVVFLGALAGAVIGAYSGVTVERLRGQHDLVLRRRDDIKQGLLAINEHAAAALRICADLQVTEHWPTLYGDDWRKLRAKQLPGQAADMLTALARLQLLLVDPSTVEQRVSEYFDILMAPDNDDEQPEQRWFTRAAAAHTALKHALREELEPVTATRDWAGTARRLPSQLASHVRVAYLNRRGRT